MEETESGHCDLVPEAVAEPPPPAKRCGGGGDVFDHRKRAKASSPAEHHRDFFDGLPDDIILIVLCNISRSAGSLSDLINVLRTCQRLNILVTHPMVLSKISREGTVLKAECWTESAHRLLNLCTQAGSIEACYTFGMICFYCLGNRKKGISLMAKAGMQSLPEALYSLSIIHFNGSGRSKNDKNLRAGVALCARARLYGHLAAIRELGHCLQDGYGVQKNIAGGRRFLEEASAREAFIGNVKAGLSSSSLLSDIGCSVPVLESHPVNRFLVEWFATRGGPGTPGKQDQGLRMCSYGGCGRPETRRHEFRRCSVCGVVNYCSRACQAIHWKLAHKTECTNQLTVAGDGTAGNA